MRPPIEHSSEPLPDEEDVYGVNEIDEYDPDYRGGAGSGGERRPVAWRAIALLLVLAFLGLVVYYWR